MTVDGATHVTVIVATDSATVLPTIHLRDQHTLETSEEVHAYVEALQEWIASRPVPGTDVRPFRPHPHSGPKALEEILDPSRWPDAELDDGAQPRLYDHETAPAAPVAELWVSRRSIA